MKKRRIRGCLGIVLSMCLLMGNVTEAGAVAKSETIPQNTTITKVEEVETANAVLPDEIQKISQETAQEIWEELPQTQQEECIQPAINSTDTLGYGYSSLETEQQKEFYGIMTEAATKFHQQFGEPIERQTSGNTYYMWGGFDIEKYDFTLVQLRQVVFSVGADHPEFFWLTGNFTYSTLNGTIGYFYPRLEEDYISVESRKEAQEKIDAGLPEFLNKIDEAKAEGASEMQMELLIHDMIANAIDYAYVNGTSTPEDAGFAHSIEGVFSKRGAVCEGYAKSFQLLADYAGLESIYAVGYGNGGGHAWNLVCLDGEWYNVDVTWDDSGSNASNGGIRYVYYNCNTQSFGNHVYRYDVFPGMYQVPATTADQYNYFIYYKLYVNEEDVESQDTFKTFLADAVSSCNERQDYLLQIKAENSSVQNQLVKLLTYSATEILNAVGDSQKAYRGMGNISYTSSGGYVVYWPLICFYADCYQVPYTQDGAELSLHMKKGRTELAQGESYTVTYTDNTAIGTAKAYISGLGDYESMFPVSLEFTVVSPDTITNTVTPTATNVPTSTVTPTIIEEPTVTVASTVTVAPTVTVTPTVTIEPTVTVAPTVTTEPTMTPELTVTPEPTMTIAPTVTEEPVATEVPTSTVSPGVTEIPTNTLTPTITESPKNTVTPTITAVPTNTGAPTNTVEPTITNEPPNTVTPTITENPTVTVAPTATVTEVPTVTPTITIAPTSRVTPTNIPTVSVPKQVSGVKFVSATSTAVTVSYQSQPLAKGYEISLYQGGKRINTVKTVKTTYTFRHLTSGTVYQIAVRAYADKNNSASYGKSSNSVKVSTATKAPAISKIKKKGSQLVISWKKVSSSKGYEVYMSQRKNGSYKKIGSVTGKCSFKYSKKMRSGRKYYFKVRTYVKVGNKKVYSSYSKVKSFKW